MVLIGFNYGKRREAINIPKNVISGGPIMSNPFGTFVGLRANSPGPIVLIRYDKVLSKICQIVDICRQ